MVAVKTQFGYPAHRAGEGGIKMAGDEQEAKYKQMIETPVPRLVAALAVPTIISMLVT